MSEGIFAAYLLGYDTSATETQVIINSKNKAEFADGDDDKLVDRIGDDKFGINLRFDVPPAEAIEYFRRKKVLSKKEFEKLKRQAKAAAFTVSGIYEQDVLDAFKQEIESALEEGRTKTTIVKKFKEILNGAGHKMLGNFHLETVMRSNALMAQGVGRRKALEEVSEDLPYWEYSAVGDDRTRPTHQSLDGIIFPANHPFWDTHYPPWGMNCRCGVNAVFDYPQSYNHNQPNKDTLIAYDDKGLPAKAEYKTQVVDLKATKFVGVPKSADLEKALKDAAKRGLENRKRK